MVRASRSFVSRHFESHWRLEGEGEKEGGREGEKERERVVKLDGRG